jgi:hypothetical protein
MRSTLGFEPIGSTPEEFANQMRIGTKKWEKVIRAGLEFTRDK